MTPDGDLRKFGAQFNFDAKHIETTVIAPNPEAVEIMIRHLWKLPNSVDIKIWEMLRELC